MGGNKSDIDFLYFHGFDSLTLIIVIYYGWNISEKSNGSQAKFWFTLLCEVSFEKESQEKLMRSYEFSFKTILLYCNGCFVFIFHTHFPRINNPNFSAKWEVNPI